MSHHTFKGARERVVRFEDRHDAGRQLAQRLRSFADAQPVVLGIPRGGVPVAFEVASSLAAPLDVIVVRKLGVPFQPELAMGAVGENGVRVLNPDVLRDARVRPHQLAAVEDRERAELLTRSSRLRGQRAPVPIEGRTVLIIDDGIATGSTARASCQVARARGAARVVLAVPVAPPGVAASLLRDADDVICLQEPHDFYAVGQFYADFGETSDTEVAALLERVGPLAAAAVGRYHLPAMHRQILIPVDSVLLPGTFTVPYQPQGVVVFAHGSGSSQNSRRNRSVAATLNAAGMATLLFDLLTTTEERDHRNVFDIHLLAQRLHDATDWVRQQPEVTLLPVGYFGASTGAAAALSAAAGTDADVAAIVSRGGRPDLAMGELRRVRAPTLLIVGGRDHEVLELNRRAQAALCCHNRLEIVPRATHLFEEPGALQTVARLAGDWFTAHLTPAPSR